MNTYVPFSKQLELETIVNIILGGESIDNPVFDEGFVAMWAGCMPTGTKDGYYALPVENWIQNAIGVWNEARSKHGAPPSTYSSNEMQFLREYLIERFSARLHRYSKGRKLVVKVFNDSVAGFRWETW